MRKLKKKVIPKFKSEARERAFWASHDSSEYLDWTKAQRALLPNLKPSLRTISLRLPEPLIARLKVLAHQRDVPYQSLLKVLLAERLKQEEAKQGRTLRPAQSLPHSLRSGQALSAAKGAGSEGRG